LQARLARLRGKLTAKGKSINRFEAALASTQGYLKETRADLTQALEELSAVDEALGEFYCPVLDPETDEPCGSYWKDHGVNMMRQALDVALQAAQDQSDEVQELWLSPCEAEGLRRQLAQAVVAQADAELAAHVHDKACGELAQTVYTERKLRQEVEKQRADARLAQHVLELKVGLERQSAYTERALRQEAEQRAKKDTDYIQWLHRILREGGYILNTNKDGIPVLSHNPLRKLEREKARAEQRAEHAEPLAALVTPELALLLEKLASDCYQPREYEQADDLAARIREALGESDD